MSTSDRPTVLVTADFSPEDAAPLSAVADVTVLPPIPDARAIHEAVDPARLLDAKALVVELGTVTDDTLRRAPALEFLVVCRGTPVNVDLEACAHHGVAVRTTPGRNAAATADLTLALILDAVRHVSDSQRWLREGRWTPDQRFYPYETFRGPQLSDLTLGIVGLGNVGRAVVRRAQGFGMTVLGHGPHLNAANAPEQVEATTLDDLLSRSDVVSLHTPARPETAGLLGTRELARMRPGAILINTARASLVDHDALVAALRDGSLAAAAIDVFEDEPPTPEEPLLDLPTAILTPHIGGASDSVVGTHTRAAIAHLRQWLDERSPS